MELVIVPFPVGDAGAGVTFAFRPTATTAGEAGSA
jgi:hypothetical protein